MSLARDIRYKDKLKHEGHDLIDALRRMGIPYAGCYRHLSRDLGWPEYRCHFQVPHTIEDYHMMVASLRRFHDTIQGTRRGNPWRKKKRKKESSKKSPKDPGKPRDISPESIPDRQVVTMRMKIVKKRDTLPYEEMKEAFRQLEQRRAQKIEEDSPFIRLLKKMCVL